MLYADTGNVFLCGYSEFFLPEQSATGSPGGKAEADGAAADAEPALVQPDTARSRVADGRHNSESDISSSTAPLSAVGPAGPKSSKAAAAKPSNSGGRDRFCMRPRRIDMPEPIKQVACGQGHLVALSGQYIACSAVA